MELLNGTVPVNYSLLTGTVPVEYLCVRRGGGLRKSLDRFARSRLRGPRSSAPAPWAPVSQASGLLLVLLDQDYQANTPPPRAHVPTI